MWLYLPERKSATRQLNKLLKEKEALTESNSGDSNDEDALATLESRINTARIDLNYTIYCPLTEKYISLYPNQRHGQGPELASSNLIRNNSGEKPPLWYTVEKSMKDNTLELLRDGKLRVGLSGETLKPAADLNGQDGGTINLPILGKKDTRKEAGSAHNAKNANSSSARGTRTEVDDESDGGFFEE